MFEYHLYIFIIICAFCAFCICAFCNDKTRGPSSEEISRFIWRGSALMVDHQPALKLICWENILIWYFCFLCICISVFFYVSDLLMVDHLLHLNLFARKISLVHLCICIFVFFYVFLDWPLISAKTGMMGKYFFYISVLLCPITHQKCINLQQNN